MREDKPETLQDKLTKRKRNTEILETTSKKPDNKQTPEKDQEHETNILEKQPISQTDTDEANPKYDKQMEHLSHEESEEESSSSETESEIDISRIINNLKSYDRAASQEMLRWVSLHEEKGIQKQMNKAENEPSDEGSEKSPQPLMIDMQDRHEKTEEQKNT